MLAKLQTLPDGLNAPTTLLADTGYYSEANVAACTQAKIEPLIAVTREGHPTPWQARFAKPDPLAEGASEVERMRAPKDPDRQGKR